MWANRWYIALTTLVFLVALVVQMPLQLVWSQIQPQLTHLPVKFSRVSGSVWNGQLSLSAPMVQLNDVKVNWSLSPLSLLQLKVALDLKVEGKGFLFGGKVQSSSAQKVSVSELNGYLDSAALKPMLTRYNVVLEGDFNLNQASAQIELHNNQPIIKELGGQVVYSGGKVGFPIDGNPISAELPMLLGSLQQANNQAGLDLTTTESLAIGRAYMQTDGWAGIAIRRRFLDIIKQPWPAKADADTVIFEVSQKVL